MRSASRGVGRCWVLEVQAGDSGRSRFGGFSIAGGVSLARRSQRSGGVLQA